MWDWNDGNDSTWNPRIPKDQNFHVNVAGDEPASWVCLGGMNPTLFGLFYIIGSFFNET